MPALALVTRFKSALAALEPNGPYGVAVSGGPDSLALLLLAHAAGPIRTATVDHGLRSEAREEAAVAARYAATLGVPHQTLTVSVRRGGEGVQGEARAARYAALAEWAAREGLVAVLTAHHADDQAETLLMRLQRGAGLPGLAGIRAVRPLGNGVMLVRPLLDWRRADLAAIVADAGWTAADDPSNRDPRFDRTRVRALLAETDLDPARLARAAAALAEADAALDWAADAHADRLVHDGATWTLDPTGLPRALRRRLLARALDTIRAAHGLPPHKDSIEPLLAALESGKTATRADVRAEGGATWRLTRAPARKSFSRRREKDTKPERRSRLGVVE